MNDSYINQIFTKDSRNMSEIPDNVVQLMITSPPYNVTKEYDENLTLDEYLALLRTVFMEVYRVTKNHGFIAVNIANVGRKPYIPLDCYVINLLANIGYKIFDEIIWNKKASAGASCAWGSWQSAANPCLRDVHEYIILGCKIADTENKFIPRIVGVNNNGLPGNLVQIEQRTIEVNTSEWKSNLWSFQTESAKRQQHPAPFPIDLPYRLIWLLSFPGDLILDPFIGSGAVAIAAMHAKRNYVGYDINPEYTNFALNRIKNQILSGEYTA